MGNVGEIVQRVDPSPAQNGISDTLGFADERALPSRAGGQSGNALLKQV